MNPMIDVVAGFSPTPVQVAAIFWEMDAEQQADFFAALERTAGVKLCVQMAAVIDEIRKRGERGDREAQQGFQTMLAHAQGYFESAIDYRAWEAQHAIDRMVIAARGAA